MLKITYNYYDSTKIAYHLGKLQYRL